MFSQSPYRRKHSSKTVAPHQGVFYNRLSLFEGVALIVSGTIGAGVLGIPYAIAKVGLPLGLVSIAVIGLLMIGYNLLIGKLAQSVGKELQLVGLAEKFLGRPGKIIMSVIMYSSLLGALVIYIIGEGQILGDLFGGSAVMWSLIFFAVGSAFVSIGLRTIKILDMILILGLLTVVFFIVSISFPQISLANFRTVHLESLLFPYGVLVFAFHGASAVPEAYNLLHNRETNFYKAIIVAGLIILAVYLLFTIAVVGVTGDATTEIATIGLGATLGSVVFLLGNLFSAIAMGTGFLMVGVALSNSLTWDFHLPKFWSVILTCFIPLTIFLLGDRGFVTTIDVVGGGFFTLEIVLILVMYIRSKRLKMS